jgi:hypothetical protein
MAKSIVVNRINGKNNHITLPCDDTVAAAFVADVLDGEYQIFKFDSEAGTETEVSYKEMQVMVKSTTTKEKTYLNMKVATSKTEQDVFAVLLGLTINGIIVDEAFIISDRLITL